MTSSMGNGCAAGRGNPAASAAHLFHWLDGRLEKMEFREQYKHPLWQKKRLEAMTAANFICERCYDGETQLHVHHKRYVKGRKIWEYEVSELSVLCEPCHEYTHEAKDILNEVLTGVCPEGYEDVVAIIAGFCGGVMGPCHVNTSSVVDRIGSKYCLALGEVAAEITNLAIKIDGLNDLAKRLRDAEPGDVVEIKRPTRSNAFQGEGTGS